MRKFNVTVNGKTYEVEVEELGRAISTPASSPVKAAAPVVSKPEAVQTKAAAPAPSRSEIAAEKKEEAPVKNDQAAPVTGGDTISSPMPGTILSVNVKEGDVVKKGDVLFILEAMKMENEIMAPHDGKIASVGVSKGESVNTGNMLAVIK
jgi:biotin carboxyl carrier protein